MIKKQIGKQVVVVALSTAILLTGCSNPFDTTKKPANQQQFYPEQQPPNSSVDNTSVNKIQFSKQELSLAPGSTTYVSLIAYTIDNKQVDIDLDKMKVETSDSQVVTMDQQGELSVNKNAKNGAIATITANYEGAQTILTVKVVTKHTASTTKPTTATSKIVSNPSSLLVIVNKHWSLPASYVPSDLVQPNIPFSTSGQSEKKLLRKEAATALEQLFAEAKRQGIELTGVSGYRSYATQKALFESYVETKGYEHASMYSALPGHSEHQTGLAIDVSSPSVNSALEETFGQTKEAKWLAAHAADFGFIIRYPQGKTSITGYAYEPWHIRYVGKEVAKEIMDRGITLDEYR